MVRPEAIIQFNTFIGRAQSILLSERPEVSASPTNPQRRPLSEFEAFIAKARPVLVSDIQETLRIHQNRLQNLFRWILPSSCDVLAAAGLSGGEDAYTNLVKWLLWPEGNPELALRCQKDWLKALGLHEVAEALQQAVEPVVQFVTDDGRPDMIMLFQRPAFILIVEAKTGSEEHQTPSNQMQTQSYPSAAREKLGLSKDHPGAMVFLTTDAVEAADPNAINTTFEKLVIVLSQSISPNELSDELRCAYRIVLTHLLTHASPGGVDGATSMLKLAHYFRNSEQLSSEQIIENLSTVGPLCRNLRVGSKK